MKKMRVDSEGAFNNCFEVLNGQKPSRIFYRREDCP